MSLRDNIDNTNTEKNKLKIGKRNIDNKLVELGGEKSIDISDVPEKIEKVTEAFSKIATIYPDIIFKGPGQININYNLDFTPDFAIISLVRTENIYEIETSFDTRDKRSFISTTTGYNTYFYYLECMSITNKNLKLYNNEDNSSKFKIKRVSLLKV